jgi:hypothetical protein
MAFEFLRYVTHGDTTATRDILAMVVLQGGSSWLISLGQLVYLFEILLGVATAVLGAIGILYCFGKNALCPGTADIDQQRNSLSNERQARVEEPSEPDAEVTIRLEDGHLWLLRRHRCIVTVHTPLGGVKNTGREVWDARSEKSHR